jgi:hypothetical protein
MRALLAVAVGIMATAGAASASSLVFDDPAPGTPVPEATAPCDIDVFCGTHQLIDGSGFIADGEWNPVQLKEGWVTTNETIVIIDELCGASSEFALSGGEYGGIGVVTRAFAWGVNPADGDFWTGSWVVAGFAAAQLTHFNPAGVQIASFQIPDPDTGLNMQISGLGMDHANGHLWGILRNNPVGTLSRFVEFDVNSGNPVLIFGPCPTAWNGGPSAVSSAGLEYNSTDCTILANRQDANNVGTTELTVFQDLNPAGAGPCPAFLGFCNIVNTPCIGGGQGQNRPWGIALVESVPYVITSDLNLAADCATPVLPNDFHILSTPAVTGQCATTAVEPSTWGNIKNNFKAR